MSSAENIRNAFYVVHKTYQNIEKLIDYCKTVAPDESNYVPAVDKFLRYKSDSNLTGWFIPNFIMLFQNKNDMELENEWREGPIYVMEIELYNPEGGLEGSSQLPQMRLSKFTYESLQNWAPGCSPTNHWRFFYPLRRHDIMSIKVKEADYMELEVADKEASNRYYWGVQTITSRQIPLTEITADNAIQKIFQTFDRL
ncbi:hypothetical protein [Bacillus kwashiorkori]|uniref:hypothetical protein n=1 Tax=Bacillus kwashiorkori TaxID=1522318 RepID=UPI0007863BD6|nr:hypothetical protein [Bacillus kwashiorkori]